MALPNLGAVNETLEVHDLHTSGVFHDNGYQHSAGIGEGPAPHEGTGISHVEPRTHAPNPDEGKYRGETIQRGGLAQQGEVRQGHDYVSITSDPSNPIGPTTEPGTAREMSETTMREGKIGAYSTPNDVAGYNDLAAQTGHKPYTGIVNTALPHSPAPESGEAAASTEQYAKK